MADPTFCRLTVLAPRRRVDVALPADVPVAELVPMVLELVGEPEAGRAARPQPWRLTGVAGGSLPAGATLAELGMLDGEQLRLAPSAPTPPAPVFDDPVDALAAGAAAGQATPRFETAVVVAVAVAAAGLLAAAGPGSVPSALIAGGGAIAAVVGAGRVAHRDDAPAGLVHAPARGVALAGVALAAAAGWTALPGTPGAGPLMGAVVAAGIAAAAAQLVLRVVAPTLVAAGVVAVVAAAGAIAVRLGAAPVAAATAAAALAVVGAPALARVALRLAGLPRPVVPADGAELTRPEPRLSAAELAERGDLARGYLAGLAGASAVIAAVGAVGASAEGGWAGSAFAADTVAVLLLRARGFADVAPARTALAAAAVAAVGLAATVGVPGSAVGLVACTALGAGAAAGVVALAAAAHGRRPSPSPVLRRTLDLLEGVLVTASVPLALAAMDLFRVVREL